jgi:hypothetical protein
LQAAPAALAAAAAATVVFTDSPQTIGVDNIIDYSKKLGKDIYEKGCSTLDDKALTDGFNFGTLKDGYIQRVPLPRVPRIQSTSSPVACATIHRNPIHTGYLPIVRIPTWSDLIESLPGFGRCIERCIFPFSPVRLM